MTKILVVDNHLKNLERLERLLTVEDFQVLTADSASIALMRIQQELPSLVICNAEALEGGGLSFLRTLRTQISTATIPFIFLSSAMTESARRFAMNLGADDYISMPCDDHELVETILCRLKRHQTLEEHSSRRLDELRRNLTVALPHELRTPLQGMITSAELLSEYWQTLEQDEIVEITHNIRLSADRLHRLIQKFLMYFRLDLVADEPREREKWPRGAMGTSQVLIHFLGKKCALRYQRGEDLRCELCDAVIAISEKWLSVLLEELLDNAFKFSQPEMLDGETGKLVKVRTQVDGDRWVLEIRDWGRGMTEEEIAHVGAYMQFNRLQYEQQGTGLGLAIAERIVKIYNGTMTIDSTVNEGTLLTISLPLQGDTDETDSSAVIG
ncbi:response regulator receiver sensor signal transduction histidine kinase [[Leptolyngbya] sp. PCC 7376]|uniref:hybrid sensor histidine kinase/response regulator n=1 Tax=[Leptolyngbya] sp. PCC 7376 TaxID=111781 RepID=UPI00029F1E43|nr:hybrid sensor histidine kinase/response regulator [[Leptolyngbya] sp. PCC 7376]AFY37260.1 response regulator receiver sensor signal transduction histidine kinase [[Leptolyngbya] sp. PCC 7376]